MVVIYAVYEFWFRTRGVSIRISTMSRLSTWEMYRSRPFPFRTCRHLVSSGHQRSLATWGGASRNWRGCMRRPSNVSVRVDWEVLSTAAYGLNATYIGMWPGSIWTWRSCGGAQCRGALCGRARPKTVWITLGAHDVPWEVKSASLEHFLPPWTVRRQVWVDSLKPQHSGISTDVLLFSDIHLLLVHHYRIQKRGLSHVAFRKNYMSQLHALLPLSRGRWSLTVGLCCSRCLWTWVVCCLCQWFNLWMGCCRQPRPALDRYVQLVLLSLWGSRPGRPVVLRDGCAGAGDGDIRWGPSGPHGSGSFGCPGGGGLWLSASVAPGVSGPEWYWPVVGSASSSVGQCGSASQWTWLSGGGGGTQLD